MNDKKISIVIPTYNRNDLLRVALESCLSQTAQPYEIIVVDDGSHNAEEVQATVDQFRDDRIHLIFQPNSGANVARNRGLDLAKGDVICLLDSDDKFLSGKLEFIESLWPLPENVVFLSKGLRVRGARHGFPYPNPPLKDGENYAEWFACDGGNTSSSAIFAHRAVFTKCRFTDGLKKFQDCDFIIRAQAAGLTLRMVENILYTWTDLPAQGRISRGRDFQAHLEWITSLENRISERAQTAFLARHIAQHELPIHPLKNLSRILKAARTGAIGWTHAAFMSVRWLMPKRLSEMLITHIKRG